MLARFDGIAPVVGSTISVREPGTLTLVPLYSDTIGTQLGNPFTADALTGIYSFWAELTPLDILVTTGTTPPTTREGGSPHVVFNGESPNRTASLVTQDRCNLVVLAQVTY